ncbi:MAG: hypothetical protein ABIV47_15325 [Roseiflexaceae bacterium]
MSLGAVKRLIAQHPLERFIIKGFLEYDAEVGIVRFAAQLWSELRLHEMLDVQQSADKQLPTITAERDEHIAQVPQPR